MARTRSFWGSEEHSQAGGSVDIEIERVLEVRSELVYRLTGYRAFLSHRLNETTVAGGDANYTLGLTVWEPSTTMTVESSVDSRQRQAGLFALPGKGTLDVLQQRVGIDQLSAVGVPINGFTIDTGWVVCDLVIPSLVVTAVTEIIINDVTWQFGVISEYETKRVGADEAASIAKAWGVPKPHETTW